MLKRNPGLNLIEFHTDLVPGLDRIGPPSDAVRHLGIVLNSRQGLGKRFGLPLASGGPLVESVRDCDRNYGTKEGDNRDYQRGRLCPIPLTCALNGQKCHASIITLPRLGRIVTDA